LDPRCVAAMDWLPPEELLQNPDGLQPEFFEHLKAWEMVRTAEFGVIFDMDDTMFHSKPHVLPTFRHAVRRLTGIEISDALLSQHHGKTTEQFAAYLEQELHVPVPAKEFNELLDVFEDSLHRSREVKPFRGFVQLMDQLEQVGIPIAVGTSSGRRRAERILRQLNSRERMLAVVTSEDVERHKPYPDVFLEAASRLGLPPERCIVVEDSFGGLQAARAGGMVPIANDMGYHTDAELRIAHHVVTQYDMLTVDRLTELVKRHV